jgi:UDP-N-acetylmuramoyl-L-alanyl-D-glutamate--2,6-diaminopimelate ligase
MADPDADCRITDFTERAGVIDFDLSYGRKTRRGRLPMPGRFNLENFMAAFLTVLRGGGVSPESCLSAAESLSPVPGRMIRIERGQPFSVIVDYAHTPNSFSALLPALRDRTKGRLIAVFGSAGERDVEKRAIQGEIASRYCDFLYLADEDPRGEKPMDILEEIARGCRGKERDRDLFLIPDRRSAIAAAFRTAGEGDMVVLLGKGHEKSIIYSDGPMPWNEISAAKDCLSEMGYETPGE